MRRMFAGFLSTALCTLAAAVPPAGAATLQTATVNGSVADRVSWTDSMGRVRTVSLKREGEGNAGHGGYAVQMTYRYLKNGAQTTMTINPTDAGDGFGYFVGHERYRLFSDGSSATIAGKIFGVDDSPLGRGFAVTRRVVPTTADRVILEYKTTYPKYGTLLPNGIDPDTGEDSPPLGTNRALFKRYDLPVTITWYFQDGATLPRIVTQVSLAPVPGPDRVSFDLRGPYGKMNFDAGSRPIDRVIWGDRYKFTTTAAPLTRSVAWTWNAPNAGARFNSLQAGGFEMGMFEPKPYASSSIRDGYSEARGKTSATYNGGEGCPDGGQTLPCDWEWPYQSSQYELPYSNPLGTTISEKMAWGSTPYYGTSLTSVYDGVQSVPFNGFPTSKVISYEVCLVLGLQAAGGLTSGIAARPPSGYKCAAR
ncbi:hypothetical protein ACFW16_11520 [Inquilinus sp. NPDC058860]|uniref:hypothetical protein n=1 Tax=Inquilinus sp. NPDC058860 TaxID=3346652 RepID=UPI00369E4863